MACLSYLVSLWPRQDSNQEIPNWLVSLFGKARHMLNKELHNILRTCKIDFKNKIACKGNYFSKTQESRAMFQKALSIGTTP